MTRQQGGKEKKDDKSSLHKSVDVVQRKSVFGKYSEAEMLALLKGLAMDPCQPQFSLEKTQPLRNEILRLRKVMVLNETEIPPWRKRKLQRFVKDKLGAPGYSLPNQQNGTKLRRGQLSHVSSISCLLNSVNTTECFGHKILSDSRSSSSLLTFEDTLPEKQLYRESFFLDDVVDRSFPSKDISQIVDYDESANCLITLSPENLTVNEAPSLDLNDAIRYLNSTTLHGAKRNHLQPPRKSIRLLNFIGDHLENKVVPVGPRFQADVPEWNGPIRIKNSSENSRWLGSRVWPIEIGNAKSTGRKVGKGRPNSCRCVSPGSDDCIRNHILEKRLILQCDLGPAFFSWNFDEMGEQVSSPWTLKERKIFESLLKMKPLSSRNNFMKRALMRFPKKSSQEIVHYYFTVFIPQRMSQQRRLSMKQVDTDNEEEDDFNDISVQRCEGSRAVINNSKDVKTRYLRGGC
ncbi:uncharacterized protein LOC111386826 [Olea europaea var. sylvestris]|uniref:uncharacterized protein LOC111386826 n=1 Tax=Olea europaea var. sylvestris TaxID=158386 RepID=UPI000C1CF122|nr:uncharacterized protein LOC111386826 [Olea europaea var. sylvestris]XP_022867072.1 uncharacterized protein LOC111386826 [Olea europaea var. sylvestris]